MMQSYTATASGGSVTDCPVNRLVITSGSVPRMREKGGFRLLIVHSPEKEGVTPQASKNRMVSKRGLSFTQADATATEAFRRAVGSIIIRMDSAMVSKSFLDIAMVFPWLAWLVFCFDGWILQELDWLATCRAPVVFLHHHGLQTKRSNRITTRAKKNNTENTERSSMAARIGHVTGDHFRPRDKARQEVRIVGDHIDQHGLQIAEGIQSGIG